MQDIVIYPPCKHCGNSHGMGIEEMSTGKITPMDICNTCLWKPIDEKLKMNSHEYQVYLENDMKKCLNFLERELLK